MVDLEQPDKGRAWVVAFAAFFINMILSGLFRTTSIMYVAVIDSYSVTRAEATIPFTVRSSVTCLSGPLVGILGERFGIQTVTFYGGIMACAGAALCCFAPSIIGLTVFWGGMHGLGFALTVSMLQVVVNQHFQKHRATASGIALSGSCVGSLCFPILVEWILDTYGLSGLFLLMGGMVMHVLPPTIVLCPPQWVKYPQAYARLWALKHSSDTLPEMIHKVVAKTENGQYIATKEELVDKKMTQTTHSNHPMMNVEVCSTVCSDGRFFQNSHKEKGNKSMFNYLNSENRKEDTNITCIQLTIEEPSICKEETIPNNSHLVTSEHDILAPGIYSISAQIPNEAVRNVGKPPTTSLSNKTVYQSLKKIAKLYLDPMYVLISICLAGYLLIFNPIITVLVDYVKDKGFADFYGKYFINIMAIGDIIGRLCFGWVTDKKLMTTSSFMCFTFVLKGALIVLLPLASSMSFFVVLLVLYSITAGSILVVFPILIHQYVDVNAQSVAMACVKFLSGIVSFGVPSMIGHFRDDVGSYDGMFYLTGLVSIVCGGLWIMEPIFVKYQHGSQDKNTGKADVDCKDTNETAANDP